MLDIQMSDTTAKVVVIGLIILVVLVLYCFNVPGGTHKEGFADWVHEILGTANVNRSGEVHHDGEHDHSTPGYSGGAEYDKSGERGTVVEYEVEEKE